MRASRKCSSPPGAAAATTPPGPNASRWKHAPGPRPCPACRRQPRNEPRRWDQPQALDTSVHAAGLCRGARGSRRTTTAQPVPRARPVRGPFDTPAHSPARRTQRARARAGAGAAAGAGRVPAAASSGPPTPLAQGRLRGRKALRGRGARACSSFFGSSCSQWRTARSQTHQVPSREAVAAWPPSGENATACTCARAPRAAPRPCVRSSSLSLPPDGKAPGGPPRGLAAREGAHCGRKVEQSLAGPRHDCLPCHGRTPRPGAPGSSGRDAPHADSAAWSGAAGRPGPRLAPVRFEVHDLVAAGEAAGRVHAHLVHLRPP